MTDTLPRRGIEDSMYPKPVPTFCVPFDIPDDCIPDQSVRLCRTTITVSVEFDPSAVSRDEVALDVAMSLVGRPEHAERRNGRFTWRGVRTHAWGIHPGTYQINYES